MKNLLLPLCCLWAVLLQAQPGTRQMALRESLDMARTNSAQLKKSQLDRQALELRFKEGRSAMAPQVHAVIGLDYHPALPTTFLPSNLYGGPDGGYVATTLGQPWQLNGTVRMDQPIFNEAARRMAPAANVSRGIYDLLATKAEEEVLFNTATLFYQTLQTEKLLDAINSNLGKLDALERLAQLQLDNGYVVPTDVKRIRVARTNLEAQRYNLESSILALHQTLQFFCGLPFDGTLDLVEETSAPAADSARWQALLLEIESTTEFRLLQRQLELNRIQTRSLRGEMAPSAGLYAVAGFLTQRPDANFFEANRRWYGLGAAGFRVNVPIFDGFLHRRKAAILTIESQKIEEDHRQLEQGKTLEFLRAKEQFQGTLRMIRTQEGNVVLAREITDKLALQFKEGAIGVADLLNAQTALVEAETNYWQQVFNYKLAVVKLLKAAGQLQLLTENIEK